MSTNFVNKSTGELVTLANGTRMWIGTKSAHDNAVQQGTMPNNCMVCITDDYSESEPQEVEWTDESFTDFKCRYIKEGKLVCIEVNCNLKAQTYTGNAIHSEANLVPVSTPLNVKNICAPLIANNEGSFSTAGYFWVNANSTIGMRLLGTYSEPTEVRGFLTYITD